MPLTTGTKLGPYEINESLGEGGMGEVYRALDTRLQRHVAIKVLPTAIAGDPDRIARFELEARATAALNHPNILAVHDVGSANGATFVVTELLTGSTLRQRLDQGRLPARKVTEFALRILSGLAAAHARGIAHRDLKPDNIFVTADGQIKILDFGLAKMTPVPGADVDTVAVTLPRTTPGLILGTVGYMAPEQVRGLPSDHRADIFAFGAILYEMLAGRRAFEARTQADTLSAILNADPPELSSVDNVPASLVLVMRRCLEKDPADRFQSARDVGFALEAMSPRTNEVPRLERPSSGRRRQVILATSILVALLVTAIATWALSRSVVPSMPTLAVSIVAPPDTAIKGTPAIAPDGRALVFVAFDARGVPRLWLRSFDGTESRSLPGTENGDQPFWSPDSRFVGFFARGKLWTLDVKGGSPPRVIADVSDPRGGTWSRDGTIVYSPQPDAGLYRIDATGGPAMPLTTLDRQRQEISHRWPRFLPDGRMILFMNRVATDTLMRYIITTVSVDGRDMKPLIDAESTGVYSSGRLLFHRAGQIFAQPFDLIELTLSGEPSVVASGVWNDGSGMAGLVGFDAVEGVIASRPAIEGTSQIVSVDRSGKVIASIGPPDAEDMVPSPDGRLLAFMRHDVQLNTVGLWILDLQRATMTRVTSAESSATSPVWSPDSRRVVYSPVRAGTFDLYVRDLSTGSEQQLLHTDGMKAARSWSSDGKTILFNAVDSKTRIDLWSIDATPGATPRVFAGGTGDQCCGKFSPDNHWVAFVSSDTGRPEVFVKRFAGAGEPIQVSTNGGTSPDWRANGRFLYYVAPDNRLMEVAVTVTAEEFKAQSPVPLFRLNSRDAAGWTVSVTDDRPYAPAVEGDGFLVSQFSTDARASMIHLLFNWSALPR